MRPAFEAMLTMLPPPSRKCGSAAWHMRKVPVRLTAMIFCQSSNGMSCELANLPIPAQLTSTEGRPRSFAAPSTAARAEPGSETSTR
jgi:hypothetical protein